MRPEWVSWPGEKKWLQKHVLFLGQVLVKRKWPTFCPTGFGAKMYIKESHLTDTNRHAYLILQA